MSVPNSAAGVAFKAAYLASRDPAIRALFDIPDPVIRYQTAETLALKGLLIDREIDVGGADPLLEMLFRQADGMKWVPSLLQPNIQSAGLLPGETPNPPFVPYNADTEPAGGLLVSSNPADFKPLPVPPPPPEPPPQPTSPQPGMKLVGPAKTLTLYDLTTQARTLTIEDNFVWMLEGDGHVYVFHSSLMARLWQRTS